MKVREWLSKWYVIVSIGVCINLIIAAVWISHREPRAAENVLYLDSPSMDSPNAVTSPKITITEDWELVDAQLDDGSEFSITIKEARALRKAIVILLTERIVRLESELFAAKGGYARVYRPRQLRVLEGLVTESHELRDTLSVQEDQAK